MEIIGHGIDLIEVARIEELLRRSDNFLHGWFTLSELEELGSRTSRPEIIGGRVAAKEAAVKALGTGFTDTVSWQDIEIHTDERGAPTVVLFGGARDVAKLLGVEKIVVSISHVSTTAVASAIALGYPPIPPPGI